MAKPPELVRLVRVVAVSPSDVMVERGLLERVVDELNRTTAPSHGCRLSLWRWETDSHPLLHLRGPQDLIDYAMRIENADRGGRPSDARRTARSKSVGLA